MDSNREVTDEIDMYIMREIAIVKGWDRRKVFLGQPPGTLY